MSLLPHAESKVVIQRAEIAELRAQIATLTRERDDARAAIAKWRKMHKRFTKADGMDLLGAYVDAGEELAAFNAARGGKE